MRIGPCFTRVASMNDQELDNKARAPIEAYFASRNTVMLPEATANRLRLTERIAPFSDELT